MKELNLEETKVVSGGHINSINLVLDQRGPGSEHVQAGAPAETTMSTPGLVPHQAGGNPLHAGGN